MTKSALHRSLHQLADALKDAAEPWWIIGSAAVELHGGNPDTISDIDVLVSRKDIDALYRRLPLTDTPDNGKTMFRSARFGWWSEPEVEIEFMHGLEVEADGKWEPVEPETRQAVMVDHRELFVPHRDELIEILTRFGREKDLRRAASLANAHRTD
ncbi:hypothetical protein [Erythrobacter sp. MTPC3]|uniref:hypothetical protein n=1 Tax=Erythrobacter sp. MTPC3 TaxID=3056564 RepID=UPI0036F29949